MDLFNGLGSGPTMDLMSQTGLDALRGSDMLSQCTLTYDSEIEYDPNAFSKSMKSAAQVLQADIGTRICYTQHGSFDGTHQRHRASREAAA